MPEPLINRIGANYTFEGDKITVVSEHYTYKPKDKIGEFTLHRVLVNGRELGPGNRSAIGFYVEEMRYHKLNFREQERTFLINTMATPRVEYEPPHYRKCYKHQPPAYVLKREPF